MLLQLVIALMAISASTILITQKRRSKVWSVLILLGLCLIVYFLGNSFQIQSNGIFSYQWLPYDSIKANLTISSTSQLNIMFLPLICMLLGMIYLNIISKFEVHTLHINTLLLIDFIALILLASANDFIQLMFAVGLISILSFYTPNSYQAKKKLLIFNFLSDIALFLSLATVYGSINSINIGDIADYSHQGSHKDLTAFLLFLSVGIKCGFIFLNAHYYALKDVFFNRIAGIMVLSLPLAGLIIFLRLQPVIQTSSLSPVIFNAVIILSLALNLLSALFNNILQSKAIASALSIYAYLSLLIYHGATGFYDVIPYGLSIIFFSILIYNIIYLSASKENNVINLGGLMPYTKLNFFIISLLSVTFIAIFYSLSSVKYFNQFAICYMLTMALNLHNVYFAKCKMSDKLCAFAQSCSVFYACPIGIISCWLIYINHVYSSYIFWLFTIIFAILLIFFPFSNAILKLGNSKIWDSDILFSVYEKIFIAPLKIFGRILWLAFDVVVIERNLIGSISMFTKALVRLLHNLQQPNLICCLLSVLFGLSILLIYWGVYIYE